MPLVGKLYFVVGWLYLFLDDLPDFLLPLEPDLQQLPMPHPQKQQQIIGIPQIIKRKMQLPIQSPPPPPPLFSSPLGLSSSASFMTECTEELVWLMSGATETNLPSIGCSAMSPCKHATDSSRQNAKSATTEVLFVPDIAETEIKKTNSRCPLKTNLRYANNSLSKF